MKRIIITGGDGFIGAHLSNYFVSQGYEVYPIIISNSPFRNRLVSSNRIHIVEGNVDEYEKMMGKLPLNADAFFHLAWSGVTPSQRDDLTFQMQNIELMSSAVKLANSIKTQKFIFPGSTMEYLYYGKPINKNAIPSPSNAYGVAKISARYVGALLCHDFGIPFFYVVISGIYSEDRNDDNVIYYSIKKLLNREKPKLTRLEQLWDYIHIDDVVYGLKLIVENELKESFYVLGHGDNCPLSNYIYKIRDIIDPSLPLGIGEIPYTSSLIPSSCVDISDLQRDTGFAPRISFENGIERVITEVKRKIQGDS